MDSKPSGRRVATTSRRRRKKRERKSNASVQISARVGPAWMAAAQEDRVYGGFMTLRGYFEFAIQKGRDALNAGDVGLNVTPKLAPRRFATSVPAILPSVMAHPAVVALQDMERRICEADGDAASLAVWFEIRNDLRRIVAIAEQEFAVSEEAFEREMDVHSELAWTGR